ncbi:MAG: hypothetical protein HFI08_02835 [Bacilli bacterium]|jgi:hypothetical protein|nr:hypothetical protein [Bacilli bacterium]
MTTSEKKIDRLVQKIHEYYSNKDSNTLATVDFPKYLEYKSNEWLIYIFYSCLLDYGMRSQNYHNNLISTYHIYPQIFNPKYVIASFTTKKEELLRIMKNNIHPRYPNVAVDKWLNLSKELSKYDNLLDKIKEFNNFNELNLFIRNIQGFGQKTGGLLLRLIYESGVCNFNDKLGYIPLDRHDIEISYLNNIIDNRKLNNKQIEELSSLYIKSGEKLGIDANLIDKYLWNIGNDFCNRKKCIKCPLYDDCKTKEVS